MKHRVSHINITQLKTFVLSAFVFMLSACVTVQPEPALWIESLIVVNQTETTVENFELRVPKTGGFVSCSYIPENGECALGFKPRTTQPNTVYFSWKQGKYNYTREITLSREALKGTVNSGKIYIKIRPNGYLDIVPVP